MMMIDILEAMLRPLTAAPDAPLPPHIPLNLLGLDSLDILDLAYQLENRFSVDLSDLELHGLTMAALAMEIEARQHAR